MMNLEPHGAIAHLVMDMPDRQANVWNEASLARFAECIEAFAGDEALEGLVIRSNKSSFLAGGDLDTIQKIASGDQTAEELNRRSGELSELLRRLETCGKPVVAAINGAALGGGYELCLACHHRIVVNDRRAVVGLPETQLGLIPAAGGTQRLPRLVGVQGALGVLMEGKSFAPDKALKLGLVDQVVEADELLEAATKWLEETPCATQPWDRRLSVPGGDMDGAAKNTLMVATALYNAKTFVPGGSSGPELRRGRAQAPDRRRLENRRPTVKMLLGDVARAMVRTLFLDLEAAKKGARPPQIGAHAGLYRRPRRRPHGQRHCARGRASRANVVVIDRTEEGAQKAHAYAQRFFDRRIQRGRATQAQCDEVKARIQPTTDYAALASAQLVIEAVFEDRAVKAEVSRAAETHTPADAVIASNTSTLPITGLAEAVDTPQQFIGLHFFSPVERMALVEIIRGEQTDDRSLALALDLVAKLGKVPVVVNDARVLHEPRVWTYITEGVGMLTEGLSLRSSSRRAA